MYINIASYLLAIKSAKTFTRYLNTQVTVKDIINNSNIDDINEDSLDPATAKVLAEIEKISKFTETLSLIHI